MFFHYLLFWNHVSINCASFVFFNSGMYDAATFLRWPTKAYCFLVSIPRRTRILSCILCRILWGIPPGWWIVLEKFTFFSVCVPFSSFLVIEQLFVLYSTFMDPHVPLAILQTRIRLVLHFAQTYCMGWLVRHYRYDKECVPFLRLRKFMVQFYLTDYHVLIWNFLQLIQIFVVPNQSALGSMKQSKGEEAEVKNEHFSNAGNSY